MILQKVPVMKCIYSCLFSIKSNSQKKNRVFKKLMFFSRNLGTSHLSITILSLTIIDISKSASSCVLMRY